MKINFVLASTLHGTMIVPRNDFQKVGDGWGVGVGGAILERGHHELDLDIPIMKSIVDHARRAGGPGVVVIDGGANIGTVTVTLAHQMRDWGFVHAFEPQDRIFMALCGNVVINNLLNVRAYRAALAKKDASIDFPVPDYGLPSNFGGLTAPGVGTKNDIGQTIRQTMKVPTKTIDSLELPRLDLLKLDLEGMELEALAGAAGTIERCRPVLCVEHIKVGPDALQSLFADISYASEFAGLNLIAAPPEHPIIGAMREAWEQKRRQEAAA